MNKKTSTPSANCFTCQFRDRSEWCDLSQDEVKLLNNAKRERTYLPGEVIYHEGDPSKGIYCIESGMTGMRKIDSEGNSVLLRLAYPGDTLGYRSFLSEQNHHNTVEVLKPSQICFIDHTTVRNLLASNPSLGLKFLKHAVSDVTDAEEKFMRSATLSVRARLAHILLVLRERYATISDDGSMKLELPISRQDLAAMIGTRPETVSRTIKQLEGDGVAHFSGRNVHVPAIDSLLNEVLQDNWD